MPINPTLPTDGQSDWDVPLNAALEEIIDEVNAQETDIAGKANTSHTHAASDINSGTIATARLGSGTADSSVFLRGDQTWATPAGGGGGATDLEGLSDVDLTSPADNQFLRYNGSQWVNEAVTQDDIGDGSTYKQYSGTEKTKLAGIATGATANDTDANLKARANHTGTQTASTISDFDEAARDAIGTALVAGNGVTVTVNDGSDTITVAALRQMSSFSKAGTLTTGTGTFRLYNRSGATRTIHTVTAAVGTQPTGASILVDVNKNGTTIFTTQSNRPTIAVSTNEDESGAPDVTSWAAGDYLTVDIDQIGSTVAGADLVVTVVYS